ncbi:gamma-glutamyltranspeptidase 1 [Elysia marginata]|uniref:Gamma-glutamyltranspeptidase 1 n=1 Tax=Elysia marginata TaxID=1093978 RepID=A0AAV4JUD9_9GAST|nr:gamma-glutamyltranspeptidase 1 [Elysia marginata]
MLFCSPSYFPPQFTRRMLTFGIISTVGMLALLVGGLVVATRQTGPSHTSPILSQGQADAGDKASSWSDGGKVDNSDQSSDRLYQFKSAAVASDSTECSSIGKDVLVDGGNAVDATIASLLCLGLTDPQSMGIGGGFFMTIYNATTSKATAIDARETAPMKATVDMFEGDSKLASSGHLSIAVPAEVQGYWHAHQKYGHLPWSKLFEAAIKMAQNGFPVSLGLHHAIEDDEELLSTEPTLREIFINKETGKLFKQREIMRRPQLAETLKVIAAEGLDSLGTSTFAKRVLADLEEIGAIISNEDFVTYKVLEKEPIEITLSGSLKMISPPPPSSGVVLSFMLAILDGYNLGVKDLKSSDDRVLTYHRTIEAFKFAYAKRTALGDEDFVDVKELVANLTSKAYVDSIRELITDDITHDYNYYGPSFYTPKTSGTSHLSVLDQYGNAVSVTSTINGRFGAGLRGSRSGIIWNNEMDDFSAPNITNEYGLQPSEANFIEPGKRPLSSMCPVIVVDSSNKGEGHTQVRLVTGAAGGSRITSATAWVMQHNLWLGKNIQEAVDGLRLHHQLLPPETQYEEDFDQAVIQGLKHKGHNCTKVDVGKSIVQGIDVSDGWIYAASDFRKGGSPDGF